MQKIDIGGHQKALNNSGSSASTSTAAATGLRRAGRAIGVEAKRQVGQFIDRMRARKVSSAVQTSDQDIAPIAGKKRDQLIAELSRMLVIIDREIEDNDADEADLLLKALLNENIRRLVIVERASALNPMGVH